MAVNLFAQNPNLSINTFTSAATPATEKIIFGFKPSVVWILSNTGAANPDVIISVVDAKGENTAPLKIAGASPGTNPVITKLAVGAVAHNANGVHVGAAAQVANGTNTVISIK